MVVEFVCGFLFWGGLVVVIFISAGLPLWIIEQGNAPRYPGTNLPIEKDHVDSFSATSMWMGLKE